MDAYRVPGRSAPKVDEQKELEAFALLVKSGTKMPTAAVVSRGVIALGLLAYVVISGETIWPSLLFAVAALGGWFVVWLRMRRGRRLEAEARASALEGGRDDADERAPARVRLVLHEPPAEGEEVPVVAEPGRLRADAERHA